jgi:DegV family protein with EDD domain
LGSIRVVTDSTANLPADLAASKGIEVVPLQVMFGSESFADGIDITNEQFYERLKQSKALPTTSQPAPGQFAATYRRLLNDGASSIISLHISHRLSGTYAAAVAGREMVPGAKIAVLDTLSVTLGLGILALRAAEAVAAGLSHEEVVALIARLAPRTRVIFVVDTLEYLQKGGRIGAASAFLGSLLSLKPILAVRDGLVQPVERVRTKSRALDHLAKLVAQEVQPGSAVRLVVLHGQALGEATDLAESLRKTFQIPDMLIGEVGPVIATHTGPGAVGVAYYTE